MVSLMESSYPKKDMGIYEDMYDKILEDGENKRPFIEWRQEYIDIDFFSNIILKRLERCVYWYVENLRTSLARKLAMLDVLESEKRGGIKEDYYTLLLYHAERKPPLDECSLRQLVRMSYNMIPWTFRRGEDDRIDEKYKNESSNSKESNRERATHRLAFWINDEEAEGLMEYLNSDDRKSRKAYWMEEGNECPSLFYKLFSADEEWNKNLRSFYGARSWKMTKDSFHLITTIMSRPAGRIYDVGEAPIDKSKYKDEVEALVEERIRQDNLGIDS